MTFHNGRLLSTTDLQCACGAPRPDWRAWEGCYVRLMKRCWWGQLVWSSWLQLSCRLSALYLCSSRQTIQHWTLRQGQPPHPAGFCCRGAAFSFYSCGAQAQQDQNIGEQITTDYWILHPLTGTQLPVDPSLFRLRWGGLATQPHSDVGDKDGGNVGGPTETTWAGAGYFAGISVWTVEIALLLVTNHRARGCLQLTLRIVWKIFFTEKVMKSA